MNQVKMFGNGLTATVIKDKDNQHFSIVPNIFPIELIPICDINELEKMFKQNKTDNKK